MTFESLGLAEPLLRAVRASGYTKPTPIQLKAIPAILEGADIMAAAQTGTGKTAGFTLPLLQMLGNRVQDKKLHARALVLTPTRELAAQVQDSVRTYGRYLPLRSAAVFGGVNINSQIGQLRRGVDVLVATPGRLLDLWQQKAVRFDDIEILVLDEADRMLDMGFIHDIKKIMGLLPARRQNLMFSATFSDEIRQLAKGITNNPREIDVAPRNTSVETVTQIIHPVDKSQKPALLSHLVRTQNWYQVLVFSRTKHGADKLVKRLARDNIRAEAIHGNKSQPQRTRTLAGFKKNSFQVLIATDIASRGIDIDNLDHVVNYDLPHVPEDYVHRIGRTGRAGASGRAVSLVCAEEHTQLKDIERLIQRRIERETIEGFMPEQTVPDLPLSARPAGGKRPAKKGNGGRNHRRNASGNKSKQKNPGGGWRKSGNRNPSPASA
ncbi:MAG: DEAD/DEAH box helicase [Gammaproteobacteria bacterium]|jgi:ATP-dependent RNA helicase RhlE